MSCPIMPRLYYQPLRRGTGNEDQEKADEFDQIYTPAKDSNRPSRASILLIILLVSSAICNMLLFVWLLHSASIYHSISGLPANIATTYRARTDFWSENETLSDELWESIDTSPIAIAPTHLWAKHHGLPDAGTFPWDNEKGTYFVKAFHQIHCLKLIRRLVNDLKTSSRTQISWRHYEHCLDGLRQDIMCYADDTPLYGRPGAHMGDGQVVQCRDWNKLVAWTQAPERNACYRTLSDYRQMNHTLEWYAFCPQDSPYHEVSTAYFEKWGHEEPFES